MNGNTLVLKLSMQYQAVEVEEELDREAFDFG